MHFKGLRKQLPPPPTDDAMTRLEEEAAGTREPPAELFSRLLIERRRPSGVRRRLLRQLLSRLWTPPLISQQPRAGCATTATMGTAADKASAQWVSHLQIFRAVPQLDGELILSSAAGREEIKQHWMSTHPRDGKTQPNETEFWIRKCYAPHRISLSRTESCHS